MRTTPIVFLPPTFDELFRFGQCFEPVHIEAFIAESAIERLDERIVGWLAGTRPGPGRKPSPALQNRD